MIQPVQQCFHCRTKVNTQKHETTTSNVTIYKMTYSNFKICNLLSSIQGMINKRPDCCNKSFMLIDTAYSSLSPSK